MNNLQPCPFCGFDDVKIERYSTPRDAPYFWCQCKRCGAQGGVGYDYDLTNAMNKAIDLWNRRVDNAAD